EQYVRVARLHLVDQPLPEREWLGVRIIDAEDADALLDPEQGDVAQLLPERNAVGAVEVRVDDVLIFLRRVLRIAGRSVWAAPEASGGMDDPASTGSRSRAQPPC